MDIEKTSAGYLLKHKGMTCTLERHRHVLESYQCMALDKLLGEIESLRAELAGEKAYHEGYKEGALENVAELADQLKQARDELAASQAREKVLRAGLQHAANCLGTDGNDPHIDIPLQLPADDTALREMLTQAQEEMRERCATEMKELAKATRRAGEGASHGIYEYTADVLEGAEASIRALEVKP